MFVKFIISLGTNSEVQSTLSNGAGLVGQVSLFGNA